MEKSIYSREYRILLKLLRELREAACMTQEELAKRIGTTQSFVTKCERGERRLDLVQLRQLCIALGTSLPKVVREFEKRIG